MASFTLQKGYKVVSPAPSGDAGEVLNENFIRSSNIPHRQPVIDILATPPGSPSENDRYLVADTGATGDWAGQENNIAEFIDAAWQFFSPEEGWILRDNDENVHYIWSGTSWEFAILKTESRTVSSNSTVNLNDGIINVDASAGDVTITLLPAAQTAGLLFRIFKIDSSGNSVIIDGDGLETINNNEIITIKKQFGNVAVASNSDNSNYNVIGQIPILPILVDVNGNGDATSITDALAIANGLSPSASNPILIEVTPGIYTNETNPLVVPTGVSIDSPGELSNTFIEPTTTTDAIFDIESGAIVSGLTVRGANGVGGIGFRVSGGNRNGIINLCSVRDCETGILATGSGSVMAATSPIIVRVPGETMLYGVVAETGASVNITNPIVLGTSFSPLTSCLFANGGTINGVGVVAQESSNGLHADDGGTINVQGTSIVNCVNSLHTGPNGAGGSIFAPATIITNSGTWDIITETSNGIIHITGVFDPEKRSITAGSEVNLVGVDRIKNISFLGGGAKVEGGLSVGVPGGEFLFADIGEGGPYRFNEFGTEIVEYWSYDDSATSGNRFTRFTDNGGTQLTDNGDAIIIGSRFAFAAAKIIVDTVADLGASSVELDFWDGSSWINTNFAVYGDEEALAFRGISPLTAAEVQFIEHSKAINGDWVADNDITDQIPPWDDGEDHFAIRLRNSGGLVSGATFNTGEVRGNDFSVHADGDVILWGSARGSDNITILPSLALEPSTNSPLDENVSFSTNITTGGTNNEFASTALDQIHYRLRIPDWIDSASPATIRIAAFQLGTGTGDVEFGVRITPYDEGDVINGTLTEFGPFTTVIAAPGIDHQLFFVDIEVLLPGLQPGSRIAISFERDASAGNANDTLGDNVVITDIDVELSRKRIN